MEERPITIQRECPIIGERIAMAQAIGGLTQAMKENTDAIRDLSGKVHRLQMDEAGRAGAIGALKWALGFVGFAAVAAFVKSFVWK